MNGSPNPRPPDVESRLAGYRELFARSQAGGRDVHLAWLEPLGRLPFRLGESLAEIKVPYAFDDPMDRLASEAVTTLAELLRRRFTPGGDGGRGPAQAGPLREESLAPRVNVSGSLEALLSARAPRLDPHLDAGLLDAWTGRGGPGARLVNAMRALLLRAWDREVTGGGATPWTWLVTLALVDLLEQRKALIRETPVRAVGYDRMEKAVGTCLHTALCLAVESTVPQATEGAGGDTALLVRTVLNPLTLVTVKAQALQNDLNPWQLRRASAEVLESVYEGVLQENTEPARLEDALGRAVAMDPAAEEAAARAGLHLEARRRIFDFLGRFDDGRTDWMRLLGSVVRRDAELDALLGQEPLRAALRERLAHWQRRQRLDAAGAEAHEALSVLLTSPAGDATRRPVAGLPDPDELIRRGLAAFLVYVFDRFGDAHIETARGRLLDARTDRDESRRLQDEAAGRVFRLSPDGRAFLAPTRRTTQGQLFVDLKGFTRRTWRAKEVVMADFMREAFYGPMLEAARRRFTSVAWAAGDAPPVELHNLLGDAAAFAGPVTELVALARDLQRIGREYEARLKAAAPSLEDAPASRDAQEAELQGALARLQEEARGHRAHVESLVGLPPETQARRVAAGLRSLRDQAEARRRTVEQEPEDAPDRAARLARLQAEQARIETLAESLQEMAPEARRKRVEGMLTRPHLDRLQATETRIREIRRDLERRRNEAEEHRRSVIGFGLETGIFISHGAAAETLTLEDPVFGALRVAIGEKINEAARGTARSPLVERRLETLVAAARRNGAPAELPFSVFVDNAYALRLDPGAGAELEAALASGDVPRVQAALASLQRSLTSDRSGPGEGAPPGAGALTAESEVHNLGIALSGEALRAFAEETSSRRLCFRRTLARETLHPEITARFLLPATSLDLVVSAPDPGAAARLPEVLVFRLAGETRFRGFGPSARVQVWELLGETTPFFRALARHHLPAWIAEARAAGRPTPLGLG